MNSESTITVLGKTFNSEEERRTYFREELRKHLPELKKMEGFPIGEDQDILNLSDPPYYTACPNPWINDFVAEWEEDKKRLEVEGKRSADFVVDEPYASDVSEGKNNPIYMAHSYHTKVPHPAIMRYILKYTQPGDVVFDGFAGTGMTGVAASLCDRPDEKIKQEIELEGQKANWGKRNAICGDLSPIASFIASNFNTSSDAKKIKDAGTSILKKVENNLKWLYEVKHDNKINGIANYFVWSDVLSCPDCQNEIVYFDEAVDIDNGKIFNEFNCSNCGSLLTKKKCNRAWETKYDDLLGITIRVVKTKPVLVNYSVRNKRFERRVSSEDIKLIDKIFDYKIPSWVPVNRMIDGSEGRRNDRTGITHVHHFYSKRNLIFLSEIWQTIDDNKLKTWITASMIRTTKMYKFTVNRKMGTVAGTLYIPSLWTENAAPKLLKRKLADVTKAFNLVKFNNLTYTGTANNVNINSSSVDYIFTDPPFGANIMYSELNYLWESWLNVFTNSGIEAVENNHQGKRFLEYQNIMLKCFIEYYRILKPGKWMTVEFSNTSAAVWNGIQTAIQNSGFVISNVAGLDRIQGSFKTVNSLTAVKQDLVISCYKPSSEFDEKFKQHQKNDVGIWDFVDEHLHHLPIHMVKENSTTAIIERSPKILFDRLIAFYVQKSLPVPIDAGKFQQGLSDRFIERDGMFFTDEQVQEYDKKKSENPEFIQLSLLVSSEQDGVMWLKILLKEKKITYQDLQPKWMKALAGVRKGDIIPELMDILEENFLKDEEGKWYMPDAENEADLEKLRTKRLLKQFDTYKIEAIKPKAKKIKEVRVEALRAGFKNCYQEKDFTTIVNVGDKIPNNLLMEDEVLLQFYDIAISKV